MKVISMDLMKELSLTPGISGFEEKIADIIERELKDSVDSIEKDNMGNIIATKKGENKKAPTIMLASHMDEIGLMVRYIDDKGYIKFSKIEGLKTLITETVNSTLKKALLIPKIDTYEYQEINEYPTISDVEKIETEEIQFDFKTTPKEDITKESTFEDIKEI